MSSEICGGSLSLGIDVGGTNTDAVLFDNVRRSVVSWAKTPTEHSDYSRSIDRAMDAIGARSCAGSLASVNISTTLATNAILENDLAPVALILIGYEKFPLITKEILGTISPCALLQCVGGHTSKGAEREPLDAGAVELFARANLGAYFAVSSMFSPRNPSHETAAARILMENGCAAATCGHQIARSRLNSVKRTVTAFLNSALIPVSQKLISGARRCAERYGIKCPVMFLRSDGSLVSDSWCSAFPIETIYSGPAASMRGAALLGDIGGGDAAAADIGGTSTDVGAIRGGRPLFSEQGAAIGAYRTMIPSLAVRSDALGGDSEVTVTPDNKIKIGPRRAQPASRTGSADFTPTDALCLLGQIGGDKKAASAAAAKLCGPSEEAAQAFAAAVKRRAAERLASLLRSAGPGLRRICVGGPACAFLGALGENITVPPLAAVASAAGAASSSLELALSAVIVHSFFDGVFRSFLPDRMISGEDLRAVREESLSLLGRSVRKQAAAMGFSQTDVHFTEESEYVGRENDAAHTAELRITAHAVVRSAQ